MITIDEKDYVDVNAKDGVLQSRYTAAYRINGTKFYFKSFINHSYCLPSGELNYIFDERLEPLQDPDVMDLIKELKSIGRLG